MKITLPEQVEIDIPSSQTKTMLIVSGGRAPSLKWLKAIAPDKKICCVDHGIDACKAADILPDFLFGDNDSASSESWDWAETHNVTINKYPREKDLTDTQLALLQTAGNNVILTGAFGGRLDHLFSNVHSFAAADIAGIIADEQELLVPLKGPAKLSMKFFRQPKAISLLSITEKCRQVSTTGLKWELTATDLYQANPYTVSNEQKKGTDTITVSTSAGVLGVYVFWE